ncbi:PaaI family thioesterase [Natronolimnobius baerhuensis]|uniref:Esterase n=1 Tax=Natronolimnobius baerhuensis TaxID=253108 RepID=A0A202E6C2_9EURY|nr:PaaI family thioesterase [Natronolimnobius baerhuensis]OVE83822.1 esterase [Natronolimnobius baerhuensis]
MTDDADDADATDPAAYDDIAEFVQYFIDEHQEFLSWIGTTVDDVDNGTMTLSVPYDEKLTNTRPNADANQRADIHGGIAATLIDTAGGLALRTELEQPLAGSIATINLNVNYLRPATGDLTATATVIRAGSSVGVSEVTVTSESPDGDIREVATGQGAYRIFRA